ncbi:MAG: hypothetical protein HOC74_28685 [Gemmatimonadetes bacterium]|nr:hypothetical protein [Gemmatimonadota bacterium]
MTKISFEQKRVAPEQLDLVAQRIHDRLSGRQSSQAEQQQRAAQLDPEISRLLEAQKSNEENSLCGAFTAVEPATEQDIDFARGYFDPVRLLAQGYALPASTHYHSPEIAAAIRLAFHFTRQHVYPDCQKPGNWWVWAKQMPDCLTEFLALMRDSLEKEDEEYILSILDYLLGKGPIPGSGYHTGKAGKDALNIFTIGVLTGDSERIARAWECMENEVSPFLLEADGTPLMTVIQSHFLGISLPYVYEGYRTVVEWAQLARGTDMALRPETTGKVARYLLDLGHWNCFEKTEVAWLSFTPYRAFWRPATPPAMAAQLAQAEISEADALRAMATGATPAPRGCRFWPSAETLILRGTGYYCALVMASKNRHPISYAYKNRFLHIGNRWYYGRDGHLVLANSQAETDPNLTYTQDWRRLTGVTRDDGSLLRSGQIQSLGEKDDYWQPEWALCENRLAGAAVLESGSGAAGIELHSGATRARKSYFFLSSQDTIVTLGSHIRGEGSTESIVHTFPVSGDVAEFQIDGKPLVLSPGESIQLTTPCWLHAGTRGYFFPEESSVTVAVERRAPDFSDAGNPPPDKQPRVPDQTFASIFFDHGPDPQGGTYACAYFLQISPQEMPDRVSRFSARTTLHHNDTGHFFKSDDLIGIACFRPGEIEGYTANRACFLALAAEEEILRCAAYEPSWQETELSVDLPFPAEARDLPENVQIRDRRLLIAARPGAPVECALSGSLPR